MTGKILNIDILTLFPRFFDEPLATSILGKTIEKGLVSVKCRDIRDWADHMADHRIKIWWGPGRHGPGNNLFFMIRDPDGHAVELSAEVEHMPRDMPPRVWPMDERTLNLWGPGWIRE